MARAHSIWILRHYGSIVAAFTVKHELREFFRRVIADDPEKYQVVRVLDGTNDIKFFDGGDILE